MRTFRLATIEHEGRNDPVGAQASDKGRGLPVAPRCGIDQALAPGAATVMPDILVEVPVSSRNTKRAGSI